MQQDRPSQSRGNPGASAMSALIRTIAGIAAEIDEVYGPGTALRDAVGTFAVLAAGCLLAALIFIATGG